jgi:hypothetical protein
METRLGGQNSQSEHGSGIKSKQSGTILTSFHLNINNDILKT